MGTAGDAGVGLRRLRLLAGYSMRDLAEAAGVSHSIIARAERGYPVSEQTFAALVRALGPDVRHCVAIASPVRRTTAGTNAVVAARHKLGLSRRAAAKRFGVSDKTLARVEAGQPVHPSNAKQIALALGLDVATLLDLASDENGKAA